MSAGAKETPHSTNSESRRGWIERCIVAVTLLLVIAIRVTGQMADPPKPLNDPAMRNLLTLIFSFFALVAAWFWISFRSHYPPLVRRLAFVAPFAAIAMGVATFRFVEFSGSMVPRFAPRWSAGRPEKSLGKVESKTESSAADLLSTSPDDFPQFLGPERTCWIARPKLVRDWDENPPKLLWKRPIGAGWSAFAAVNGYAVTMEQRGKEEWITCYEIATGNPVWGHSIAARHDNPMGGLGPRATPTIHNGRVYALGATGVLRCLDGATGKLWWSDDLRKRCGLSDREDEGLVQWGRSGSPLVVDKLIVVPGGGKSGKAKNLVAFDAQTGSLVWESENRKDDGAADQIAYASPALATLAGRRQILIVNESTASGHDPASGERLWMFPWPGHSNGDASSSQPVPIGDNQVLLSKGYSGGAELIELNSRSGNPPLAAESKWKNPRVLQTKFTNVVVHDGYIYGLSEGILECVEAATGKRKWKSGRFEQGQILGVGELLLVLSEDGELCLVDLSPTKFNQLGAIQALEGKTWNNLCLYGHRLLIRNGQEAACYELP